MTPHRDPKDSSHFHSNYVFGNVIGGEFLIFEWGIALDMPPGSAIHGRFDILLHGVAEMFRDPDLPSHQATQRQSLAIYEHHDIYEAIARYSAMMQGDEVRFFGPYI